MGDRIQALLKNSNRPWMLTPCFLFWDWLAFFNIGYLTLQCWLSSSQRHPQGAPNFSYGGGMGLYSPLGLADLLTLFCLSPTPSNLSTSLQMNDGELLRAYWHNLWVQLTGW